MQKLSTLVSDCPVISGGSEVLNLKRANFTGLEITIVTLGIQFIRNISLTIENREKMFEMLDDESLYLMI